MLKMCKDVNLCTVFVGYLMLITEAPKVFSVRIKQLHVPEVVKQGTSTTLDCDYTLEGPMDEGLVVKWYFNDKPYPVYQWIPNSKPQELGVLKGRLNLNHVASMDYNSQHRSLQILRTSAELSGNYTCKVSTFTSEDSQTKNMLVFAPGTSMEVKLLPPQRKNQASRVMCLAEGVYPKPTVKLFIKEKEIQNATLNVIERQDGHYNTEIWAYVTNFLEGTEFTCELRIVEANYTMKKAVVYYEVVHSGGNTWRHHSLFFICVSIDFLLLVRHHLKS